MREYKYHEIEVGLEERFSVTITKDFVDSFTKITGDLNPLHIDKEFAKQNGFSETVVYGMLSASYLSTMAGMYLPGKYSLIHSVQSKFVKPVFANDTIEFVGKVVDKNDTFQLLTLKIVGVNQNGVKVLKGEMKVGVNDGEKK